MPELLIELFSEEIPARMQAKAAEDLRALITNGLVDAGLTYEGAQAHATPRRLVLSVEGLQTKAADTVEERKGPRIDAPIPAIEGFLKSTGLKLDQLAVQEDKKGKSYIATIKKSGRAATEIVAELLPKVIREFPWPKSMRWGSGTLRWVRPLQSIICTFDGEVVALDVDGIKSSNTTRGHRFLSKGHITVRRYEDYADQLFKAHVIVDAAARLETVRADAKNLAFAQGLEMIEDEALLKEVAGLVEWPVVLMGSFDENFLSVPPEVIITTIKVNQKCFCLKDSKGKLANKYLLVANTIAADGGKTIIAGNNKVIAARLSDAKFFWDQDRKVKLEDLLPKLKPITFHAKLGSQEQRSMFVKGLAIQIGQKIGSDPTATLHAAQLAKADLVTGMVGEFPELQGIMGGYYALEQGYDQVIAVAIREHWKPQGPSDAVPTTKVGMAVALADKLHTLSRFWWIDEKPTGSKDPFALRRAALGTIRILIEGGIRLPLKKLLQPMMVVEAMVEKNMQDAATTRAVYEVLNAAGKGNLLLEIHGKLMPKDNIEEFGRRNDELQDRSRGVLDDLLSFFGERLKVYLKDQGARHDLIDAVFSLGGQDDLLMVTRRVEALSKFLDTDDGKNLLAGVKRASNILRIEEKKDGRKYSGDVNPAQLIKGEEKALHSAISQGGALARKAIEHEDFEGAMRAIAKLRAPVDEFFEGVTVNDKDATFRENRLRLLNRIREAVAEVADFSKIEG